MAYHNLLKTCLVDLFQLYWKELGLIRSTSSTAWNEECDNDTEARNRRCGMQKKELNHLQIFSIALVTFILAFAHGWVQLLVNARMFYLMTLLESALILSLLYVSPWSPRKLQKSFFTGFLHKRSFLILGILQSLFVIWTGIYIKHSAAMANRSDLYELLLVLNIPSAIICMQFLNNFNIKATESIIFVITGIKLLVLCRDPIFIPHTVESIICLFISIAHGFFLGFIYLQLNLGHIVSILQQLTAWKIPVAFLLAIYHGEDIHQLWSLRIVSTLFLKAFLSMTMVASTLLLLKYSNPLCCIVTSNLSWIPLILIRSFIFKFLFLISSFKLIFLFILDLFVLMFKYELDKFFESLKYAGLDKEYNTNFK